MRIVIAPDSFKGSLDAAGVAAAIAAGAREALEVVPGEHTIIEVPMADGGEGTLSVLAGRWAAPIVQTATVDPLGRPHTASWAMLPARNGSAGGRSHAVIELAEASGLPLVADVAPRVLEASTMGTGTLITDALDRGVRQFSLCVGGSATVDGGIGLLAALGAKLRNEDGHELPPAPASFAAAASLDLAELRPEAQNADWVVLVDVVNPLLGPDGAAAVFGPQKGASPAEVELLEDGLRRWAELLRDATGVDVTGLAGGGAAGGVPAGLHAVLQARLTPGASHIAELLDLEQLVRGADLVITGEGRLDGQSAGGKVVSQVAASAAAAAASAVGEMAMADPAVVCLAGSIDCSPTQIAAMGLTAAFGIARGAHDLATLMRADVTAANLAAAAYSVVNLKSLAPVT